MFPILFCLVGCALHGFDDLVAPTVEDDASLPALQLADGTLLHLEGFGDASAPLLVVLHGGPGGDYCMYEPLAALADTYHVVLWDQRGTGLSQRVPQESIDGPTYLADLAEIADLYSPGVPFVLLGHSWGGAFATYYALNYPERLSALVLVEPGTLNPAAAAAANTLGGGITSPGINRMLEASDALLIADYAEQDYYYRVLIEATEVGSPDYASPDEPAQIPFWRDGFLANRGINDWQGFFGTPTFDVTTGLAEAWTGPTLLLAGTASGRIGLEFQQVHAAPYFTDVQVVAVEGAGHYGLWFEPDTYMDAMRTFLDAVYTAGSDEGSRP